MGSGELWTYSDYLCLVSDERYEVIDGDLLKAPTPYPLHQAVSREITFFMWDYVKRKNLGVVFDAPIDVVLDPHNVFQPDIVYISKERKEIIGEKAIMGAPDLVVEIISPSTLGRDTVLKRNVYERKGVRELWLIYPDMKCIEVLCLDGDGKYYLHDEACLEDRKAKVSSKIIKGFRVELKEVFETS